MAKNISAIFERLKSDHHSVKNGYKVESIPSLANHKLGITEEGMPMFFIRSSISSAVPNINLNLMSVQFCQLCRLVHDNGQCTESTYTVVALKTTGEEMVNYFLEIIYLVLLKIGNAPSQKVLVDEIEKIVDLFRMLTQSSTKTIQGLWAELLMISLSKNPEYMIKSWHVSPSDIFDFNDGRNKIEVKSTSKSKRIHHFSLEQLSPNQDSNLLICSIMTFAVGQGVNIFDLAKTIDERLDSLESKLRLNSMLIKSLGDKYTIAQDYYFDFQKAKDSLQYFSYLDVPKVDIRCVPSTVSHIHFDSDLSEMEGLTPEDPIFCSNSLFQSL